MWPVLCHRVRGHLWESILDKTRVGLTALGNLIFFVGERFALRSAQVEVFPGMECSGSPLNRPYWLKTSTLDTTNHFLKANTKGQPIIRLRKCKQVNSGRLKGCCGQSGPSQSPWGTWSSLKWMHPDKRQLSQWRRHTKLLVTWICGRGLLLRCLESHSD